MIRNINNKKEQLTRAKDCGAEIDHLNLPSFPPEPT